MQKNKSLRFLLVTLLCFMAVISQAWAAKSDKKLVERGRYMVRIGGCNDCHTDGYLLSEGKIPESEWLKGSSFGWRGPWGTTYPRNLRLFVKDLNEKQWIKTAKTLKRRPPMPWFNLNAMNDNDLRAIYHFIKSLGEPGKQAPDYVPPEVVPPEPYALFPAPPPVAPTASAK